MAFAENPVKMSKHIAATQQPEQVEEIQVVEIPKRTTITEETDAWETRELLFGVYRNRQLATEATESVTQ